MFGELKHDMVTMKNEIRQEWKQDLRQEMSTIRQDVSNLRQEHHTSLRNLEIQVAQHSKALTERPQGSLPSTTVNNPRERAQAVTLRSGKELPEPILKKSTNPKSPIEEGIVEEILEDDNEQEKEESSLPLSSKATQAQDKGKKKVDLPMYQPLLPFPGITGNGAYLKLLCDDNDNGLESFIFDENALSSENNNDVHDALHDTLDDDDVNDNDGLCDLNDIEFVNFFDDCIDDALYVHEILGEVEEEREECERDDLLSCEKEVGKERPQQVKLKRPKKNEKNSSLAKIRPWTPDRTRVRSASRGPRSKVQRVF
nr:uncharacterized protein LOC109154451 [Ipomoea batatas]